MENKKYKKTIRGKREKNNIPSKYKGNEFIDEFIEKK